jgi:hypothetical protein
MLTFKNGLVFMARPAQLKTRTFDEKISPLVEDVVNMLGCVQKEENNFVSRCLCLCVCSRDDQLSVHAAVKLERII